MLDKDANYLEDFYKSIIDKTSDEILNLNPLNQALMPIS